MSSLTPSRKLEIEAQVNDLLSYVSDDIENISLPIDLSKILSKLDIKLQEGVFDDSNISGAYDKKDKTIWVSYTEPYKRKVFTVAHELGHFLLHKDKNQEVFYRNQLVQIAEEKTPVEVEANYFAASLLMPKKLVKKYWNITHDTEKISKIFGVSNTAAYWRIKNLGLLP